MRREREKKKTKEIKLQRVRKEVLRATGTIHIELLASRSPLAFHENNESSRERKDVEKTLRRSTIVGEGLEGTLKGPLKAHYTNYTCIHCY